MSTHPLRLHPVEPHGAAELLEVLDNLDAVYGTPERAPDPQTRATWRLDRTLFQQAYRKEHMT
jgi:hypothetical protein